MGEGGWVLHSVHYHRAHIYIVHKIVLLCVELQAYKMYLCVCCISHAGPLGLHLIPPFP